MNFPFRYHHVLYILNELEQTSLPLDALLNHYFRSHSSIGSKDRKFICNTVYQFIRWKNLWGFLAPNPSLEEKLNTCLKHDPEQLLTHESIPVHIRYGCPEFLMDKLMGQYGREKAIRLCHENNQTAPIYLRANLLKISPIELYRLLKPDFPDIELAPPDNTMLRLYKREQLLSTEAFKEGLFEIQDASSQAIAHLVQAKPHQWFLDYCAGSGGKSLAIAPQLKRSGQIFLYDIRKKVLLEAKKRLKRAGIQNYQICSDHIALQRLQHKCDWVLVDAPCSGTGTLRRNPDLKWKQTSSFLNELVEKQKIIFKEALTYLKKESHIVYATCSILHEENEEQVDYFTKNFDLELVQSHTFLPESGGGDGLFGAVLRKKI